MRMMKASIDGDQQGIERLSDLTDMVRIRREFDVREAELNIDASLSSALYSRLSLKDY